MLPKPTSELLKSPHWPWRLPQLVHTWRSSRQGYPLHSSQLPLEPVVGGLALGCGSLTLALWALQERVWRECSLGSPHFPLDLVQKAQPGGGRIVFMRLPRLSETLHATQ